MIDLVNSVRFTVQNQPAPTTVHISLDSALPTRTATAKTAGSAAVSLLPTGVKAYSIFHVVSSNLEPNVNLSVRFDPTHYSDELATTSSALTLWAYNDGWHLADWSSINAQDDVIQGHFSVGIVYVVVGTQAAPFNSVYDSSLPQTLGPGSTVIVLPGNPDVPEPTGLMLSVVASALLMRRRPRN